MKSSIEHEIKQWMSENRQNAIDLLQRLVMEPSTQGNEAGAQKIVADKLVDMGLAVDVWEDEGQGLEELVKHPYFCSPRTEFNGSPNVVGLWKGCGGGKSLILNGHIDVVPTGERVQWRDDPFSGKIEDGRMYGRGVTDMKGGNIAMLFAIEALQALGVKLKGDVIFQSVVEEESGGSGTLSTVLRGYKADAAIIPEPTQMKVFPKQQGSMWFKIRIKGRSAHGGTRYEGVSAIEKAMLVVEAVRQLEKVRNDRICDPLYKSIPIPIPINIGTIEGGEWPSSVPDRVELKGRMGVAPEEEMGDAKQMLAEALAGIKDEWLLQNPPEIEWFGAQWLPGAVEQDHALMNALVDSYRNILGEEPVIEASPWGTDGGLLAKTAGTPAIVFGPGVTSMAHYPNEYIELDKVFDCAAVVACTMLKWCGVEEGGNTVYTN
ncbi:peptidase [Aneurinibacillus sp. Ricciae_BoGa-3]|uniref:peptidase n=1 Tax=Aneurinibacillus sp. Ricciae_BoGa-3 TaxID=3022697 RepID=UPI0023427255|nr:peptidase [Aneurinibacillus sp. Ricciae_BoGa-3]WCK54969.1 peptidase [Aneurinibacillus sp. Ricciae_BoGa-3]